MSDGLRLNDVHVVFEGGGRPPVDGVSFEVARGECLVLLGESGCGKSLTALAAMRLLPEGVRLSGGDVQLDGVSLPDLPEREMRAVRGGRLAMIFQEPMTSLNPVLTVATQIRESLAVHRGLSGEGARQEAERLMSAVGLSPAQLSSYPFQMSGGQRQRALIAMMLAGDPSVLIADEPTTALDVTVQAQILQLLKHLQQDRNMGLLLVTHDLDVARDMADRLAVMYAGEIVETGTRDQLYSASFHPYTQGLFKVLPSVDLRGGRLAQIPGSVPRPGEDIRGCRFAERCPSVMPVCREMAPEWRELSAGHGVRCHLSVLGESQYPVPAPAETVRVDDASVPVLELRNLCVAFPVRSGVLQRVTSLVRAVDGVDLAIRPCETVALVGESGCGKTTLARAALRLIPATSGQILLEGEDLTSLEGEALRRKRSDIQIVFQDPFSSLNPRMQVGEILKEGIAALRPDLGNASVRALLDKVLDQVGLPPESISRYPHEFSGGQRQRIAIARALVLEPKLLVCDEPTSALDVSVQAQILNLLADLQQERRLAYLFITHNLAVVGYLADRVAVMYRGRIVEEGEAAALMSAPAHPYTRMLLESAPGKGMTKIPLQTTPAQVSGDGCAFVERCPVAMPLCRTVAPESKVLEDGRRVSCHR